MKTLLCLILFSFNAMSEVTVIMETSKGTIEVELNEDKAPITVKNFLSYVDFHFFDGTLFHRAVKNFVIQGGGVLPDMTEKPTNAPIKNEATNGLNNLRGTIGMARDNEIDTATAQFFINTVDNTRLDHQPGNPLKFGYAVFGFVTSGMDVVDAIQNVAVHAVGDYENAPVKQILIYSIRRK
ncbi:MAG TPA: peptidylprolyl isomerase [Bacteriovoracaceae bacterium]|nr:peptidylprolyl isomerase [Bacteriovoracaceae bacterium]